MMEQANRVQYIKEYYFSTKLKEIADLKAAGIPVINLGIGSPDLPPPDIVINTLTKALEQPGAHQYQNYRGTESLRQAIARFYQHHYQVGLDASNQILPLIGSKEGIMHISMAFLNEGDKVLIPDPGYLTYTSATLLAGGHPDYYALNEANNYWPNLDALAKQDLSQVKLMWVNYPHMPSGTQGSLSLFKDLVAFAQAHDILLVNDNPYSFILTDKPLSILQVPEALPVAMELNSLSKSHNMAGWRIGFLSGSTPHIDTVAKFKSQMDSGMFYATQQAAVTALEIDDDWYQQINAIYSRRKDLVLQLCHQLDLKVKPNQVGLFVWAQLPKGLSSRDFTDQLLSDKAIFITPGFIFGKDSDNYVRLSLTNNETDLQTCINRLK